MSDIEILSQALLPGAVGFTIDAQDDGLAEITKLLAKTSAKYLAIVAHGEPGIVHLGNNPLKIEQLQAHSHLLQEWGVKEIALYSCEVAQGNVGKDLIYQLSELTGSTVAATATKTGSAALGGSWNLAVTTGAITAPKLFQAPILQTYQSVLVASFGAKTTIPAGTDVNSVRLGDLNGDGKLDIITANNDSDNVSVLLGDGLGGFSTASNYAVGTSPVSAQVGDFNGDSKLDIITANEDSDNISLLLNNGSGGFNPAINYAVGITPFSPRIGDFNGDGKLDVVTANNGSNNISVLLNNGVGGFNPATSFTVGSNPYSTVVGDFNGDGKLDIITAGEGTSSLLLSVLLGDGSGGFTATANVAVDRNPQVIRSGDFNGDGKLDLAMTEDSYEISVLLGNGSGGFGSATKLAAANYLDIHENLVVGDFNGDGKLDLLSGTLNYTTGSGGGRGRSGTSFFAGDGTGSFSPAINIGNSADENDLGRANDLIAGDFNGDGKLDVASANGLDNTISVLLNNTVPIRNDFNSDSKSDILWRNDDGSVALWQMNGLTATPSSIGALPAGWTTAGTGDFSGDGKADILLSNTANGSVATWQMNGSAVTKATTIGTLTAGWSISGTGDFNGDTSSDVLLTNTNGTVAQWQMNNGIVTTAKTIGTLSAGWSIAGTADFNSDGNADILLKNTDGTIAVWQMNRSDGLAAQVIGAVTPDWMIAGTGDFNGDGNADILFRNTNGAIAEWKMGSSDGYPIVRDTAIVGSSTADWKITGTGDYNGDGNADILWRNDNGSVAEWQMNGSNVLSAGLTSIPSAASSWNIAAPIG